VGPFVLADLAEQVGERFEAAVLGREQPVVRLVLDRFVLLDEQRVLVLDVGPRSRR
jgi:hypothetical protein